ncbi:MAG: ABC transporter [Gammaproteobacteria bacterium RIFCSPHIGHO2_12_FULL_37_14]|nr:MAG: ABC transporter [Gammaproteobacteria bacterium RIFCSPHIGHO2_12_FULL_37_14]
MTALTVKQLTKQYPNGTSALKGINLDVAQGDFFALLGQNGAGKSTTISIICSLVKKTSGKVYIFGHDTDQELALAKSFIGIVPQEINFGQFEKISHILINQAGFYGIPKHIAITRMEIYLKKMGLWEMHDQPAMRLSGGMKRRLMIARALMNQPKLLILDEPTAGVDIELRHTLWDFLTELNQQGTTIILTTHYLEEAEHLCKHVAIIDHGEIIEHADMKSLINRLHTQTMVFDLEQPLFKNVELSGYDFRQIDPTTLEIEIHRAQSLNDLFQLFTQQQIRVASMRNKTNRLEELFIHLISGNKKIHPQKNLDLEQNK